MIDLNNVCIFVNFDIPKDDKFLKRYKINKIWIRLIF